MELGDVEQAPSRDLVMKFKELFQARGPRSSAVQGGIWLAAGGGAEQGLRLLRNVILARILAPEAFGVMAIVTAVNAALEAFTQVGIREAIIHDAQADEERYLNGAWWLSFGRAVLLVVVGIAGSTLIVEFYRIPGELRIIQLSFLSILFNGTLSARAYTALKGMDYRTWAIINHGGAIFGVGASIALSFKYANVSALVFGLVAEGFGRCLLSYLFCPYLPRLRFERHHMSRLIAYARGMAGLPVLYLIYAQAPILVIGRVLTQRETGLYSMASALAQAPVALLTVLLNQLLMPAFSSRQKDTPWLNAAILKSTRVIAYAGIPVAMFVVLYSPDLLAVVYGAQYAAAAGPLSLLFVSALVGACGIPIVNVYLAIGQPHLQRLFSGVRAFLVVLLIYPAITWRGMNGAALAVGFAMGISYFFQVGRMRMLTRLDTLDYWRILAKGCGIALVVLLVWFVTYNRFSQSSMNNLILGALGSLAAYAGVAASRFSKYRLRQENRS